MDNPKIDNTQQIAKATTEIRPCGGPSGMDMALPGDGDVALGGGGGAIHVDLRGLEDAEIAGVGLIGGEHYPALAAYAVIRNALARSIGDII